MSNPTHAPRYIASTAELVQCNKCNSTACAWVKSDRTGGVYLAHVAITREASKVTKTPHSTRCTPDRPHA